MKPQIITAMPIPFTSEGDVDVATYQRAIKFVAPHIDGVLVAGTTGEFLALDDDERLQLFEITRDLIGADRTIAHLGHASGYQTARLARKTLELGILRTALITPYYLPTDDAGLVDFYRTTLAAAPDQQLYAYLFPERTGIDVAPAVLQEILALQGIVGVKLSGAASEELKTYAKILPEGQELYSGNDATLPHVIENGGHGVVSGVSSVFPELFAELARKMEQGEDVSETQKEVARLVALTGPNIRFLKIGLAARVGGEWGSRMSMPAPTKQIEEEILAAARRD